VVLAFPAFEFPAPDLSAFDSFGLLVLLVLALVIPVLGVTEFRLLNSWLRAGRESARTRFYWWVMAMEWALTLVFLFWWIADGRGLGDLGLIPRMGSYQILVVAAGLALTWVLFPQMNRVLEDEGDLSKVRESMGGLWALAPRNNEEQRTFLGLSITAGICEELLYRGFLQYALAAALGPWPALLLTALVFGLGHVYQGWPGVLKTGGVGLVFGLLAMFSGSLYVGMILHAAVDLTSGRMLQAAMNLGSRQRNWSDQDWPDDQGA
jgi:membrane protease YdiL (CAAX protease family)